MGTTVSSLGNKTEETSSESPSWVEVLLLWRVSVNRNLQPLFYGLRDFITLNSFTILLSFETRLGIPKDAGNITASVPGTMHF